MSINALQMCSFFCEWDEFEREARIIDAIIINKEPHIFYLVFILHFIPSRPILSFPPQIPKIFHCALFSTRIIVLGKVMRIWNMVIICV